MRIRRVVVGENHLTVQAEVCLVCGERYFARAAAEEILAARKRAARP